MDDRGQYIVDAEEGSLPDFDEIYEKVKSHRASDHNPVVMPRQSGKTHAGSFFQIERDPARSMVTIAGMKISEQEFLNVVRSLGDEDKTIEYFVTQAQQQRKLQGYYGGAIRRHGSSPFNPKVLSHRRGRSLLWDRYAHMDRPEQNVIVMLAQRMRDTYMPHHRGGKMEVWDDLDESARVKWIEMAVVAVRELDKLGLMTR